MTTEEITDAPELDKLNHNIEKIEELSRRLATAFAHRRMIAPAMQAPGAEFYMKATQAYLTDMMAHPSKILEQQVGLWGRTLRHFTDVQEQLAQGHLAPPATDAPKDRRFSNPLWDDHPYFSFVKQQYLIASEAIEDAVHSVAGLDARDKKRLEFFSSQILDLMSPANYLGTNPEALQKAVETEGQSLIDGMENLVRDLEANNGELLVTLADKEAFEVGGNIATTPGSVVFRNRMFELIQYAPTTEKVHKTPLVIFPPWINKFYIMDLKEKNSLIKWIVDQGYTLFVVSWVNPDPSYAEVGMAEYIEEGYLTAFDEVKKITGQDQLNVVGYCIAGTTLAMVLALLEKRGDKSVKSATFFTTLTDFSDQGEFSVFLDDDFVDGISEEVAEHGILSSFFLSRTFSYLRSTDLIYTPAIKSYMMGEAPPAFDLLYWNGDSTNLPARMTVEYLRWLCQKNLFAGDGVELMGETLSLADVKVPLCSVAAESDHIAAWKDCYRGVQQMGSKDKTFILGQSGHIAGIINPPAKGKYGHYLNDDLSLSHEDWRGQGAFEKGSWWPHWQAWLAKRSGPKVKARVPGTKTHPILTPAPGTYVVAKPSS